jgi:hypothetical protein
MLTKTYFYKRDLFALVPKAQLILPSYSLQISYTLNLYSQEILTKNLFNSLITKFFSNICFTLFLIYFKLILWTIYQPKTEGFWDQKMRDLIFFKTSTLDVNYDGCHQKRVSSPDPEIFQQESTLWDKDFKRKERVIKNDEDLATFWPTGFIENA